MTAVRHVYRALAVILLLGLVARLAAVATDPGLHADEFFQFLEPPWTHLTGVGLEAWEWNDGIRSWGLPGYHGAWMALCLSLGIERGATIATFLQVHWAVVNLLLVWAAFRGGRLISRRLLAQPGAPLAPEAGWQGGLLAALCCALFAPLVTYAGHTMSEMPALLCFVFALVLTGELLTPVPPSSPEQAGARLGRDRALAIGALLALGVCVRIASVPLAVVAPLWLLLERRFAFFGWVIVGALPVVALFGLLDLVTWGGFLSSYVGYLRFNFIEGRAAQFGVRPPTWYFERLFERLPLGLPLLLVPLLLSARASWPFAASALGLVLLLSTQAHKEERFIIASWAFALIGAGGAVGAWLARPSTHKARRRWALVAAGTCLLLLDAFRNKDGGDFRLQRAWLDGQAFAGDDPGATGLLMEYNFQSGGALWFGRRGPQLDYNTALLDNPLVSHVLVPEGSDKGRVARSKGFVPMFWRDGVMLLRRR